MTTRKGKQDAKGKIAEIVDMNTISQQSDDTSQVPALNSLSKEKLILKINSLKGNLSYIQENYFDLKADVIIIKKQLELIANNINISKKAKSHSKISYTKGGNHHG